MDIYTIKVKVSDEDDVYNKYDPNDLTLNNDMLDYIKGFSADCRKAEKILIDFICDKSLDEDKLQKAFHATVENETKQLHQEKKRNNVKQLWMSGIGSLFILVGILLENNVSELTTAILSTIGSFSLWEAAAIWIIENPANRMKRRWLKNLKKTEVAVNGVDNLEFKQKT